MAFPVRRIAARAAALACGLAALGAAGAAAAQTLGPTRAQVEALSQGDPDEPIALVRLLQTRDASGFSRYLSALEMDLVTRGAERVYGGRIAQGLAGGDLHYDAIVIDLFPTRRACVESLRVVDPMVAALGLRDEFVLAVRPWGTGFRLAAGAAAALLGSLPREVGEPPPLPDVLEDTAAVGGAEISPDRAAAEAFMQADQNVSLALLNLNELRAQAAPPAGDEADAGVDGETAYARYARNALWHVMRRGGALLFAGEPIGVVVGAAGHPLERPWSQLALVYYPSRRHLRDMLADPDYRAALPHRVAGLERARVLATEPSRAFDPRAR